MDRRSVFKALGDDTRYALYEELVASPAPLSTAELAERLALHPNTVRPHLERMREIGLLVVEADSRGTVGRPQHRYRPAPGAPGVDLDPPSYLGLAGMLADVAARGAAAGEDAAAVGRREARRAVRSAPGRQRPRGDSVEVFRTAMGRLGFEPQVERSGCAATVTFAHCPYREVAEAHPELVCHLHRGIAEGVAELAGGELTEFATLADQRPCRAELAIR